MVVVRPENTEATGISEVYAKPVAAATTGGRCRQGRVAWPSMKAVLIALIASLRAGFRSRGAMHLEVLALRHQLAVYQRRHQRVRTKVVDRLLWALLSRTWASWRDVLVFVQPGTVIAGSVASSGTTGLAFPAHGPAGRQWPRRSRT